MGTKDIKSIYVGISWNVSTQKWKATISLDNKTIFCGNFKNDREGAVARDKKIIALKLKKELQIFKRK